MTLTNPLIVTALIFALLGLILFFMTKSAWKKKNRFGAAFRFVSALLMFALAALFATICLAVQGYHALTKEELAAVVKIEPTGAQKFTARFVMADGSERLFPLAGDQLYVDAHILKWTPLANLFGLHTSYELDRVGGRYAGLGDETTKAHTVFALARSRPLDMFALRQRFAFLNPLLDAEYGSATFINSNTPEEFRVMVSTSGLLIRKNERGNAQ